MNIQEHVFEALGNAKENGYDMSSCSPMQAALDLVMCDADLNDAPLPEVVTAVEEYRAVNA